MTGILIIDRRWSFFMAGEVGMDRKKFGGWRERWFARDFCSLP
jgi:hypothetical protein